MAKFLNKKIPSVFVAIPTAGKDGQLRLEGLLRYLRLSGTAWNLKLVISQATISVAKIAELAKDGTDAFLLHLPYDRDEIAALAALGKPVVLTTARDRRQVSSDSLRYVLINNTDIGRCAAGHLMSLGRFASFGFVPCAYEARWSYERGAAFAAALRAGGFSCSVYDGRGDIRTRTHDQARLAAWLSSLPQPCAILAANDNYALQTMLAADVAKLKIPSQLSIIGVDNHELIASNFTPSLSTIEPDFAANGFNAARELDRMIHQGRPPYPRPKSVPRACATQPRLVTRESTDFLSPSSRLVENVSASVNRLALTGATPDALAASLGVSRSLLALRLRQAGKPTVATLLRNRRLEEVRHLLATTRLPIDTIAERCAFPNANYLRNLFRATYGLSMREWRQRSNTHVRRLAK